MNSNSEGWDEYRRLILSELERLDSNLKEANQRDSKASNRLLLDVIKLKEEVVALKVKAGVWGLLGGVITTIGAILLKVV